MEVGQQERTGGRVGPVDGVLFVRNVVAQGANHLGQRAARFGQDACLDNTPCGKGITRFLGRGLLHIPAAPRLHLHKTPCLQLHQGFTHHRAADPKILGQGLLPQPFAGCQFLREDGLDDTFGDTGRRDVVLHSVCCVGGGGFRQCRRRCVFRHIPAIQHSVGPFTVDVTFPCGNRHRGHTVADQVA